MAGTRAPFASLAALAAVASAQGEQPGTAAAEAKKDLQSLPTIQRPIDATAGKSLFSDASAVTGLNAGTSAAPAAPKAQDPAMQGKSGNWLLDGVNQLEAEANAQRELATRGNGETSQSSSSGARQSSTATTNPFTEYLNQWLSPADQALLSSPGRSTGSSSTAPWETPRSDFRQQSRPDVEKAAAANPLQMELPGLADFFADRTTKNPYLIEASQTENTILASKTGSSDGRDEAGSLPSILTPSQSAFPAAAAPVPAPVEQAKAAPSAAPTDRLIDDRKYFPQLRRF